MNLANLLLAAFIILLAGCKSKNNQAPLPHKKQPPETGFVVYPEGDDIRFTRLASQKIEPLKIEEKPFREIETDLRLSQLIGSSVVIDRRVGDMMVNIDFEGGSGIELLEYIVSNFPIKISFEAYALRFAPSGESAPQNSADLFENFPDPFEGSEQPQ